MGIVDATCVVDGRPFRWRPLTPRVCSPACYAVFLAQQRALREDEESS